MATASNEAREVVNAGGKNMTFMGVLMIILGILACIAGGIRMIWAFKAGSLETGVLVFVVGGRRLHRLTHQVPLTALCILEKWRTRTAERSR